jgi:membrane protein
LNLLSLAFTSGGIAALLLMVAAVVEFPLALDYSATYGSLGAAIGLMMWMWMSAIIVLCGAELNSEIEKYTAQDTSAAGRHARHHGAVMANGLERPVPGVPKEH